MTRNDIEEQMNMFNLLGGKERKPLRNCRAALSIIRGEWAARCEEVLQTALIIC